MESDCYNTVLTICNQEEKSGEAVFFSRRRGGGGRPLRTFSIFFKKNLNASRDLLSIPKSGGKNIPLFLDPLKFPWTVNVLTLTPGCYSITVLTLYAKKYEFKEKSESYNTIDRL